MTTTTSGPPTSSNRLFILVIVGLIVAGLAGVAVLATARDSVSSDVNEEQTAAVEISGDPIEPMPANVQLSTAANDTALGSVAPTLVGTDFDENEIKIEADGRPKVIYFLAHWCPHCQVEVPIVQELIDEGAVPEGLDIYAVSTGVDEGNGNYPPEIWLAREDWTPLTLRDDELGSALAAFGGSAFPYVVYLDGDHQLVTRSSGGLEKEIIAGLWESTAATAG